MFPSFTSLAQREQKRQELLERAQRRVKQANEKREMYSATQWATDSDKAVSLPKKSTESTQTDMSVGSDEAIPSEVKQTLDDIISQAIDQSDLNTKLSGENSQTNPDLSTPSAELKSQEIPTTKAVPVLPKREEDDGMLGVDQEIAKHALIKIFEVYPVLDKLELHPLNRIGRQLTRYIVRAGAKIYTKTRKSASVKQVDWLKTYNSIKDVITTDPRFLKYIANREKKTPTVFKEYQEQEKKILDPEPLEVWETLIGKKRRLSNPMKNDNSDRSKQRLEDSFDVDSSTSMYEVEYNDGKVLMAKPFESSNEYEPRHGVLSGIDEDMDKELSNADNHAKEILMNFFNQLRIDKIKTAFDLNPIFQTENGAKKSQEFYFGNATKRKTFNLKDNTRGTVTGENYKDLMKKNQWMDTFTSLLDGFEHLDEHFLNKRPKKKKSDMRKKAELNLKENLKILNTILLNHTKSTDSTTSRTKERSIGLYDETIIPLREAEAAYQHYDQALKKLEVAEQLFKTARTSNDIRTAKIAKKAAQSAVSATRAVYRNRINAYAEAIKSEENSLDGFVDRQNDRVIKNTMKDMLDRVSGSGLKGRGLKGAGVAPLEGVVRRGRTYNLNEIQGLATPSAYTYRKLGSKYIRLPDLDAKTLVIVQPNRRKCGPKCQISDSLQAMIKSLVYKQHIDQSAYDKLTIEDKQLFKEILAITHLQYNFHDKLEDPLESLRAEYDKLKGEIELGNDNPSIFKQLKVITVDMYSNKLISVNEFKHVITRLL